MNLDLINNLLSKVDVLDEILECPVCYERMSENIPLCTQGHPVCQKCLIGILKCPLCNSKFNGTRDYLAESVISKIEDIKNAIINLTLNSSIICFEEKKLEAAVVNKETFPCGISYCHETLSYDDMIVHVKKVHQFFLIDVEIVNSNTYTNWWIIYHDCSSVWEKIIYIENMGIFFLKISISKKGNVYGYVQNVNNLHNTQNFYYKLKIEHSFTDSLCFNGQVQSTSDSHIKGQYLSIGKAAYKDIYGYSWLNCSLIITHVK